MTTTPEHRAIIAGAARRGTPTTESDGISTRRATMRGDATRAERRANVLAALRDAGVLDTSTACALADTPDAAPVSACSDCGAERRLYQAPTADERPLCGPCYDHASDRMVGLMEPAEGEVGA